MATHLYRSPYYGWATLDAIKRNTLVDVTKPGVIDVAILPVVVALNTLPFVVQTVESCSGHVKGSSSFPSVATESVAARMRADGQVPKLFWGIDTQPSTYSEGPFLMVVYVKSAKAESFNRRLGAMFDECSQVDRFDDDMLVRAAAGDKDALCCNCGETVRHCECRTRPDYAKRLVDDRNARAVQTEFDYRNAVIKTPRELAEFWDNVLALAMAAGEGL